MVDIDSDESPGNRTSLDEILPYSRISLDPYLQLHSVSSDPSRMPAPEDGRICFSDALTMHRVLESRPDRLLPSINTPSRCSIPADNEFSHATLPAQIRLPYRLSLFRGGDERESSGAATFGGVE